MRKSSEESVLSVKNKCCFKLTDKEKESKSENEHENTHNILDVSVEQLKEKLKQINLTDEPKNRLEEFLYFKNKNIGELKIVDFINICQLGQGNGGIVWKVLHKPTNKIMARKYCKFFNINEYLCHWCYSFWNSLSPKKATYLNIKPSIRNEIIQELRILNQCNSPYIVEFYGAFIFEGQMNIFMEHMDIGSFGFLLEKVMRIPEQVIGKINIAVLHGLNYLDEQHKIMHRDIKPSNILINHQGEIKLCDFGISRKLNDSSLKTFIGTRSYMSPERLEGNNYEIRSDLWSLGLSLIEFAVGTYPIPPPSIEETDLLFQRDPHGNQQRFQSFS